MRTNRVIRTIATLPFSLAAGGSHTEGDYVFFPQSPPIPCHQLRPNHRKAFPLTQYLPNQRYFLEPSEAERWELEKRREAWCHSAKWLETERALESTRSLTPRQQYGRSQRIKYDPNAKWTPQRTFSLKNPSFFWEIPSSICHARRLLSTVYLSYFLMYNRSTSTKWVVNNEST